LEKVFKFKLPEITSAKITTNLNPSKRANCSDKLLNRNGSRCVKKINKPKRNSESETSNCSKSKIVFKTVKVKRDSGNIKDLVKLYKNKISARKCRQKKKQYIDELENKINSLELELSKKKIIKNKYIEDMIVDFEKMEKDIFHTFDVQQKCKIVNEYKNFKNNLIFELFKKLVSVLPPLEFKYFTKFTKFDELHNFDCFQELYDKIIENQQNLNELSLLGSNPVFSKMYKYFDNFKELVFKFQDLINESPLTTTS